MTQTTSTTRPTATAAGRVLPVVHHTAVDGVPAVWADLPGDPVTTLVFGVGHEDATPATAGLTHLVEHLVRRRAGQVAVPHDTGSSPRSTSFHAVGAPARRADVVARVCDAVAWLRGVTEADLDLERQAVLAEIGPTGTRAARDAVSTRYGTAGPGLGSVVHARLVDWTAAEVREMATRWFHRGNAYVTGTAPLPPGLRVPLPDGPPVSRPAAPASRLPGRAWADHDRAELVLSGTCSAAVPRTRRTLASAVVADVLHAALLPAPGRAHPVTRTSREVGPDDLWTFALDTAPHAVDDLLVAALDVVERLADWGPTQGELDRTRTRVLHDLGLPAARAAWLGDFASAALRGGSVPTPAEARADAVATTIGEVRELAQQVADSLLVTVPRGHVPRPEATARLEELDVVPVRLFPTQRRRGAGRSHRGRWSSPARHLRVELLPDRLVLRGPGVLRTVRDADVVLVGPGADGEVEIVTSRGGVVALDPAHFRGLPARWDALLDRLPADVVYRDRVPAGVRPG